MPGTKVLEVNDLRSYFFTPGGAVRAVDGVSFELFQGETLGIVGESGCGKSTVGLSLLGLLPRPGRIVGGSIIYRGQNLVGMPERLLNRLRGSKIAMIFQDPLASLNPLHSVGRQISEAVLAGKPASRGRAKCAWSEAQNLLKKVQMTLPERRMRQYPHELSGGMRQRVLISMGLACNPDVLIADEPTASLDVTIQAQVLELMKQLRHDYKGSILYITHDFGVVAEMCDRVALMYAGQVVEIGPLRRILSEPYHPYTRMLLAATPQVERPKGDLRPLPGLPPDLRHPPEGCRFAPRCPEASERCSQVEPRLVELSGEDEVRCLQYS